MSADFRLTPVELAREAAFVLNGLGIRPATREVVAGDHRETLQPRIMQVLVVLARARGEVVSRDDLIQTCWAGRIVGEDAIDRTIGGLRRLAEKLGGFAVETVPRVGYRLKSDVAGEQSPAPGGDVLLAVLPFDNLSGQPEMVYFSDGVSEEILHAVSRCSDLRMIGRSSSFSFRGAAKVAKNVALELGATHVLDGSVRRNERRVRVSVQLIECQAQISIWSEQFDRDLSDVLALQDDIAAAVAIALKARLVRPVGSEKVDPLAYDLYLRSHPAPGQGNVPTTEAMTMLERAVSLAPQFASAWAELAFHRVEAYRRISADPKLFAVPRHDVTVAADKALELDPDNGLVHLALGQLLPWADYSGREAAFRRASLAAPASTHVAIQMGWFLSTVGRNAEALRCAAQAQVLDPLNARLANIYSQMLCGVGRYEESRRAFADFRARWPHLVVFINAPLIQAAEAEDWDECERLRRIGEERHHSSSLLQRAVRHAAILQDPTPRRCERILQRLEEQVRDAGWVDLGLLTLAHRVGLADDVFRLVDQADFAAIHQENGLPPARDRSPGIIFDRSGNLAMIENPRFAGLCAKLGLCDYWRESGVSPDCADYVSYDVTRGPGR